MRKLFCLVSVVVLVSASASAFNLVTDIEQQTQWTIGSSVAAGTALALKSDESTGLRAGQFIASALAQIANYRMFSFWAGGNFIPQNGGQTLKAIETAKMGLNLGYFLKGFTNQPPAIIKNLVVGPSLTMSIWSTPHVLIPSVDCNYAFSGGAPSVPGTAGSTASLSFGSRLNLLSQDDLESQRG